jgi:hypothetical protein
MSGTISGRLTDSGDSTGPVVHARVSLYDSNDCLLHSVLTNEEGKFEFRDLGPGAYRVRWGTPPGRNPESHSVSLGQEAALDLRLDLDLAISQRAFTGEDNNEIKVTAFSKNAEERSGKNASRISLAANTSQSERQMIDGMIGVRFERTTVERTPDEALWFAIRNRTAAMDFTRYQQFINRLLQVEEWERFEYPHLERMLKEQGTPLPGGGAYDVLKVATKAFLLVACTRRIEDDQNELAHSSHPKIEPARVGEPESPDNGPYFIELIWSYWHEEGMLVQTIDAITERFQNLRGPGDRDPLAHLEIDPLRPLNNLLWGYIQNETQRLSAKRRGHEYDHQYGLSLSGKTVRDIPSAGNRSTFLGSFHHLLRFCSVFFKEDDSTAVIADGSTLLNSLKEVRLLLAQGGHNQFGDLPWTARAEMMQQQWMLARPEIRDFLRSRAMLPCKEAWMPQVDTLKSLQGWSEITVTHFHDLAVYSEQILLSVRYGDWIDINDADAAENWARYWRPELQGYIHSYRAATGIDLTNQETT